MSIILFDTRDLGNLAVHRMVGIRRVSGTSSPDTDRESSAYLLVVVL